MTKRFAFTAKLLPVAVVLFSVATGCGDSRPKIVRPEKPTPPPDESMRLSTDDSAAQSSQPPARSQ